jgi:hypothetical protein
LNVTVVPPGPLTYITVWPTGQPQPVVSTLNSLQGFIVANAAIVPAGTSGSINVYASNATDLVIEINGYYAASFGTPNGGYQFPNASGTSLMTIAPTGNVGIGTATPGSTLDVAGDINFSGIMRFQGVPVLSVSPSGGITDSNIAVGVGALTTNSGFANTAIGAASLFMATGFGNTAVGMDTLTQNTGIYNIAVGDATLENNTSGSNNIAVGRLAGVDVSGSGSNNILIGSLGSASDSGTIRIGSSTSVDGLCGICGPQTSFFAAGIRGVTTANNDAIPVFIDSAGQLGTVNSSRRYKEDIQDMGDASSGLLRLRPVTFRYQKPFADGTKPVQYGLIAEEVAEVYPDLVAYSAVGQIETVKYQVLDSMLLNEVQRQEKEIGDLKQQNRDFQERLARLEAAMASVASAGVQ